MQKLSSFNSRGEKTLSCDTAINNNTGFLSSQLVRTTEALKSNCEQCAAALLMRRGSSTAAERSERLNYAKGEEVVYLAVKLVCLVE